jgi:hypothetical protein
MTPGPAQTPPLVTEKPRNTVETTRTGNAPPATTPKPG